MKMEADLQGNTMKTKKEKKKSEFCYNHNKSWREVHERSHQEKLHPKPRLAPFPRTVTMKWMQEKEDRIIWDEQKDSNGIHTPTSGRLRPPYNELTDNQQLIVSTATTAWDLRFLR